MGRKRMPDPEKYCSHCGKRLQRKTYPNSIEDMGVFKRRKYCDQVCMARAKMKEKVTLSALRVRARKFIGKQCDRCGTTTRLAVHHIDGNPANNVMDNLMTLCDVCHTTWHWQHGKKATRKPPSYCKVCGNPARKLDMCSLHYQRFRKYGNPSLTKKRVGSHYELVQETLSAPNGQIPNGSRKVSATELTDLNASATP